jgi:uncharacterized protein (DUF1501 family)
MKRRDFLKFAGAGGVLLSQLGTLRAFAQSAGDDYKALVCIFLNGGNDSNNTVVPMESAAYTAYSKARGALTLSKSGLIPLMETDGVARYGLNSGLSALGPIWDAGDLSVLFNVGPLRRPMTAAQYRADRYGASRIPGLFSHADQQQQWQTSMAGDVSTTGWGGRLMDALNMNATEMPGLISVSGSSRFGQGERNEALVVPASGKFNLSGDDGSAEAQARMLAWQQLHAVDQGSELISAASQVSGLTLQKRGLLNASLSAKAPVSTAAFSGLGTTIAKQLLVISRLIEQRAQHGTKRQIFYVSMGGFDTHSGQISTQYSLLNQLGNAMRAFNQAMNGMGAGQQVTVFTHSEFSRTMRGNTGGGSDHAWGSHQLIMGGAVRPKTFQGTFPDVRPGGPDDADTLGRWVPTTSVDQYAATLARWFGVGDRDVSGVLPNLSNFTQPTLDMMRS